jgi:hypothetical protein
MAGIRKCQGLAGGDPQEEREEKTVWQREREVMQQQANRLREEVLAAANANASLEEIRVQQTDLSTSSSMQRRRGQNK